MQGRHGFRAATNMRTRSTRSTRCRMVNSQSHALAFSAVIASLREVKAFDKHKQISPEELTTILTHAQRSQSSFNLQPYRGIMVQREAQKTALAKAMRGRGDAQRVLDASATVVLLADMEPMRVLGPVMDLERRAGKPRDYVEALPVKCAFLLKDQEDDGGGGDGGGDKGSKRVPYSICRRESWSIKNCALMAQTLMLSAHAHGIDSCPMEGFDPDALANALKFDATRYNAPMIIALGYGTSDTDTRPSPRLPLDRIFFSEVWGGPLCPNGQSEAHAPVEAVQSPAPSPSLLPYRGGYYQAKKNAGRGYASRPTPPPHPTLS